MTILDWLEAQYDSMLLAALITTAFAVLCWLWFKVSQQKSSVSSILARLASTAGMLLSMGVTSAHFMRGHEPGTESQLTLVRFTMEHPLPLVLLVVSFTIIYQFGLSKNRTRKF